MSDLFFICVSVQEDCVCETIDDPARGSQFKKRRTVVDINLDEFSKRSSCVHTLMILFFSFFYIEPRVCICCCMMTKTSLYLYFFFLVHRIQKRNFADSIRSAT